MSLMIVVPHCRLLSALADLVMHCPFPQRYARTSGAASPISILAACTDYQALECDSDVRRLREAAHSIRAASPGFPTVREALILIDAISSTRRLNPASFWPISDDLQLIRQTAIARSPAQSRVATVWFHYAQKRRGTSLPPDARARNVLAETDDLGAEERQG